MGWEIHNFRFVGDSFVHYLVQSCCIGSMAFPQCILHSIIFTLRYINIAVHSCILHSGFNSFILRCILHIPNLGLRFIPSRCPQRGDQMTISDFKMLLQQVVIKRFDHHNKSNNLFQQAKKGIYQR